VHPEHDKGRAGLGSQGLPTLNHGRHAVPVKPRLKRSGAEEAPEVNLWRKILATIRRNKEWDGHSRKVDAELSTADLTKCTPNLSISTNGRRLPRVEHDGKDFVNGNL
jgi:hypothetical protein